MDITIIVPVRNEEASIGRTLGQLVAQNYDPDRFEILVVDGRSTDRTREVVREFEGRRVEVRLLDNPKRLSSAARNVGVRHARGEWVIVVDGHCDLDGRDYLSNLAEAFLRSGADCLGRPQSLDVAGASTLQRAIAAARASRLGHHPESFVYSCEERFVRPQSVAVAYRRRVFDEVGLFDESFDACEDVELNHRVDRAGFRCLFTPTIRARYHPRSSLAGLFRQMVRYGRGRVRLARKHPETFSAPGFVPGLFVAGLAAGPALSWWIPSLAFVYGGALATYTLAVSAATLGVAVRHRDARLSPWLPPVYLTIHVGSGWGILRELATFHPLRRRPAPDPVGVQGLMPGSRGIES